MGRPLSGEVEVTFALYKQETDEEPLWKETQKLELDKQGGYTALIGATQPGGVPAELFRSDEARWLSVQVQGEPQSSRILLVSVPYALKAVEAEKLGGKSVSDFVLSESLGEQVRQVIQAQGQVTAQPTLATTTPGKQSATTGTASTQASSSPQASSPGPMLPPTKFSGTTSDQVVLVQQNGTGAGLSATSSQNNALAGQSTGGNGVYGQTAALDRSGVVGFAASTGGNGVVGIATSTSSNQHGVLGLNFGAGPGVAGIANAPSGFAPGVYGQTTSPDGPGVGGNNIALSGFANGVSGQSASTNGNGVFGHNIATSGFGAGVFGDASASPNGTGVFGQTAQWVGVGGQASATSGGPAYGVWGDSSSTSGVGVAGYADATSGNTNGVYGLSVSPNGNGIAGFATSTTGNTNGVYGQNSSPAGNGVFGGNNATDGGIGLSGLANGTTGNAYGVFGATATTGFGAGVLGSAFATTGTAFGIFADANSPNGNAIFGDAASPSGYPTAVVGFLNSNDGGVAGQFVAHAGAGLILQGLSGPNFNQVFSVDANGNLNISGNLTVSGTKSSTAKLQNGREVLLYAVESPENWFEDFGSGEMNNGVAWVRLEGSFAEATNATVNYHVFLTANGDSNGLYVSRKTPTGFEVREHGGGGSNVAFDYRIAVRRRGYETMRMAEVQTDVKTVESSRQRLTELTNSGSLKRAGVVKAPRISPLPAIRPVPPRPNVPALPKLSVPQPPRSR